MQRLLKITEPDSPSEMEVIRELWIEYWNWLEFAPCFQDFDQELDALPGKYAPPDGCILLAQYNDTVAGCVSLRKLSDDICEMKRLYVRPSFRGKKIGQSLANAIVKAARQKGYQRMRLDTLPRMESAISIYKSLGFREINPYTAEPIDEAKYLELLLKPTKTRRNR